MKKRPIMPNLRFACLPLACVALGVLFLTAAPHVLAGSVHGKFTGHPGIVDGDSLVLDNEELRILCIDAVELHQSCENADGQDYPCGVRAKQAMVDLIGGRPVTCYGHARDKYERPLVNCRIGSMDLGREMVALGWAIGTCGPTKILAKHVKEQKLGIWQGKFLSPPTWRKKNPWHKDEESAGRTGKTPWPHAPLRPTFSAPTTP